MPNLERVAFSAGQAPKGSKQEQMERDLEARDTRIRSLEAEYASAETRYQRSKEEIERSKEEIKGLKHQALEDKERFYEKGRHDQAAAGANAVASIRQSLRKAEANREQTLSACQSLQKQVDQERTKHLEAIKSLEEKLLEEKRRYLNDRQDRENKHGRELQATRDSLRERKEQRKDYTSYRQIFDNLQDQCTVFRDTIRLPKMQADRALNTSKSLAKALREFCAKHPGTAGYSKQLQELGKERNGLLEEQSESIIGIRSALAWADTMLKSAAHDSRLLTNDLRFSPDTEPAALLNTAYRALMEQPFKSTVERYEEEVKELERQIERSTSETVRDELKSLAEATAQKKFPFLSMRALAKAEREIQILEARQKSSYVAKAVYVGSVQLQEAKDEINKAWYEGIDKAREGARISDAALQRSSQYRRLTHDLAADIEKLQPEIRKKAQLMEALGISAADLPRLDAFIDRRLADAHAKLNRLFEQHFGEVKLTRMNAKRLRATSAPASRVRSPASSIAKKTAFTSRHRNPLEKIEELSKRLKTPSEFASVEERHAASTEMKKLKIQAMELQVKKIRNRKASLAPNDSLSEKLYRQIEVLNRSIDRRTSSLKGQEPVGATPVPSLQTATPKISRMRILKQRRRPTTSGVRSFLTSARPFNDDFGAQRQIHSMTPPLAVSTYHDLDQQGLGKHSSPGVTTKTKLTGGARVKLGENGCAHTFTPDDADSAAASEWSAATSEVPEHVSNESQTTLVSSLGETENHTSDEAAMGTTPPSPEGPQMRFQIPPADFRSAVTASASSSAAFWKYSMYRDSDGNKPTVHYCTNYEQTEAQAAKFLNEEVIGFDLEWEIGAHPGKAPTKRCVSLVQIAAEDKIGLFHISLFKGNTPAELIPPSLRRLLESPNIIKTGVNIGGDATRIEKCFNVTMLGLFELSHLYKVVTYSEDRPERINKVNFKLSSQVQNVLHLPLAKGDVRTSAWSKRLDLQQTEYAASDAYAGLRLFDALEKKRKLMDPIPPRPAFYELKMPLVLGNGHVVVPRSRLGKEMKEDDSKVAQAAEDDEEGEEFFDALEEQDSGKALPEAAATELDQNPIAYPELPRLEDLSLSDQLAVPEQMPADTDASIKTSTTVSKSASPEKVEAEQWATTFRANREAENRKAAATPSSLRAYHVWHHQGCDLVRTAALLKDPPLAPATVVAYILEAVAKEDLAFDVERMTEVVDCMPKGVRWRYQSVVDKVDKARSDGQSDIDLGADNVD